MMNWRHDPRIKKLLEKATLESLLNIYFQRVYGKDEVQAMEDTLRNALNKYEEKDVTFQKLLENNDNEAEPFLQECLEPLCGNTMNRGDDHTPESFLALSKLFMKVADFRLACEVLWCSASLAIQVHHVSSAESKTSFARRKKRFREDAFARIRKSICCFRSLSFVILHKQPQR